MTSADEPMWKLNVRIEMTILSALLSFRCFLGEHEIGVTKVSYRSSGASGEMLNGAAG